MTEGRPAEPANTVVVWRRDMNGVEHPTAFSSAPGERCWHDVGNDGSLTVLNWRRGEGGEQVRGRTTFPEGEWSHVEQITPSPSPAPAAPPPA